MNRDDVETWPLKMIPAKSSSCLLKVKEEVHQANAGASISVGKQSKKTLQASPRSSGCMLQSVASSKGLGSGHRLKCLKGSHRSDMVRGGGSNCGRAVTSGP